MQDGDHLIWSNFHLNLDDWRDALLEEHPEASESELYGTSNMSAYIRKMAIDGYIVKLEVPELKELTICSGRKERNE